MSISETEAITLRGSRIDVLSWKKTIAADPEPNASVPAMGRRRAALSAKIKEYQAEEASLKVG